MNSKFRFIFLFLAFFVNFAAQATSAQAAGSVSEDYLQIQSLLAHDTFSGVTSAASKLATEAATEKETALSTAAKNLASAKDIGQARAEFEKVSTAALTYFKRQPAHTTEVVYCPMKKVRWVQKKGPIENPYYGGKDMLACGVKE